jgi:hypothetical protein
MTIRTEYRALLSAPVVKAGEDARYVSVDRGALAMVINALRRDAEDGKVVRGEMADALLATVQQAGAVKAEQLAGVAVPEGYKLVPVEPTHYMRQQGEAALFNGNGSLLAAYRAMLSAAPVPSSEGQEVK